MSSLEIILQVGHSAYFIMSQGAICQNTGGQQGHKDLAATPNCTVGDYWTHKERKEFAGSDQKSFDQHACTLAIVVPMSFIVLQRQQWGLVACPPPITIFTIAFPTIPENAPLQTLIN